MHLIGTLSQLKHLRGPLKNLSVLLEADYTKPRCHPGYRIQLTTIANAIHSKGQWMGVLSTLLFCNVGNTGRQARSTELYLSIHYPNL